MGLPQAFAALPLHQKTYTHSPQTKLLEFFVAILAGLPHLTDLSHAAHPIDQDPAVAASWGQPAWADASGVSRAFHALTPADAEQVVRLLAAMSQPFIDQEVLRAVRQRVHRPECVCGPGDPHARMGLPIAVTSVQKL